MDIDNIKKTNFKNVQEIAISKVMRLILDTDSALIRRRN